MILINSILHRAKVVSVVSYRNLKFNRKGMSQSWEIRLNQSKKRDDIAN